MKPHEKLLDILHEKNLTYDEAIALTGLDASKFMALVRGTIRVTVDIADNLHYLDENYSAEYWCQLQYNTDHHT